ncbi:MAG TPA: hypothetical protein VHK27_15070 [Gammaproteobacteria bacterium]|nr:hypothetical protein [Gammaproteobacteria bacterium]
MTVEVTVWNGTHWTLSNGDPLPMVGFPNETNTGIAAVGLTIDDLTPYTGFGSFDTEASFNGYAFLAANMTNQYTRIDDGGYLQANRSYFDRRIDCDGPNRRLLLRNSTVNANGDYVGVGFGNLEIYRCQISNANNCINIGSNLILRDSYVFNPYLPPGSADHINPIFHGGGGNLQIYHTTFWAPIPDNQNGGGVSTNLSLFPDFAPVYDVTIENCFIRYTYGAYGVSLGWNPGKDFNDHPLNGTNIVFRNNVFERGPSGVCGAIGPVTSWPFGRPGSVFEGNTYEDGEPVLAA